MLAEAIHSVADAGNQVLLLLGGKKSQRERDRGAPVRLRPRALHLRVHRLDRAVLRRRPVRALRGATTSSTRSGRVTIEDAGKWWWVPLVVLGMAIVLECFSLRTAVIETNKVQGRRVVRGRSSGAPSSRSCPSSCSRTSRRSWAWSSRSSAVSLTLITDNYYFDVAGTAMIGLLLVVGRHRAGASRPRACCSARPRRRRRRTGSPRRSAATPGVERIIHMKTLHLGPEELLVARQDRGRRRRHGR